MRNVVTSAIPFKIINCRRMIVEDSQTKRQRPVTKVTGIFQRADVPNANGRIYPQEVMREAIVSLQEAIKERRVLGELDHPDSAKVHLDRVSHLITKVWMEGKDVFGESEILEEMPCGKMLKALIDSGVTISVSSRGVGDMESIREGGNDYNKVLPGYRVITWDIVQEPSVEGTELGIMEGKDRMLNVRKQHEMELMEEIRGILNARIPHI